MIVNVLRQPLKIARQGFSFNRNALINNIYSSYAIYD